MKIKTAVIATAGFGTRLLPITKTIQKEMLPLLNRPIIDYMIDDCIKAGIKRFIIIINEHNRQILHFYRENKRLYNYLKKMNKLHLYKKVEHLHQKGEFIFIKQKDNDPYGTAVPVKLAQPFLENDEAFVLLMGDIFYFDKNKNGSTVKSIIENFYKYKPDALISASPVPFSEIHKYGVITTEKKNNAIYLKNIVEKPKQGTVDSNLINASKYIFTKKVFSFIDHQELNPQSNELYITDTLLNMKKKKNKILVHILDGLFLDTGTTENLLKANIWMALHNKKLKKPILDFIDKIKKEEL